MRRWLGIAEANSWMVEYCLPAISSSWLLSESEAEQNTKQRNKTSSLSHEKGKQTKTQLFGDHMEDSMIKIESIFKFSHIPSSITFAIISTMFFSSRSMTQNGKPSGRILRTPRFNNDYSLPPVHIMNSSYFYIRECTQHSCLSAMSSRGQPTLTAT